MLTNLIRQSLLANSIRALCVCFVALAAHSTAYAQSAAPNANTYQQQDIVTAGHNFFGSVSYGLAEVVQQAIRSYGEPNGYILGEEGSAAFFAGATYGEGVLNTRNAGTHQVFWQGPSLGMDVGGSGNRVMMLVYNLPSIDAMYRRYVGAQGSAYLVGGFGMQALSNQQILIVPVKAGVGARLGLNMGYLKFTRTPTWNPF